MAQTRVAGTTGSIRTGGSRLHGSAVQAQPTADYTGSGTEILCRYPATLVVPIPLVHLAGVARACLQGFNKLL